MASQVESIKWVPGTRFIVDGFRFQSPLCTHYFLTHYHSDHTVGLTRSFDGGLIYCSPVTMRLLTHDMGLRPHVLRPLELDQAAMIDGVEVTPLCANHCPGAVMLLFRVPQERGPPQTLLHTGDFRWDAELHGRHPILAAARIDSLILDTTYCQPKWTFPHQSEAVAGIIDLLRREAAGEGPVPLFVCMSYHVGKERAFLGAAHALGWRVWVPPAKRRLLRLLDLPACWLALLTEDPEQAEMHVLGVGEQLHEQSLAERIKGTKWGRVVVIRPTGWSYRRSGKADVRVEGCISTIGVPYSEHSSFAELQDCVRTLRPWKLIPTVNAGDPVKSRALVDRLCGLMDLSRDRSRLDCYLRPGTGSGGRDRSPSESKSAAEHALLPEREPAGAGHQAELRAQKAAQQADGGLQASFTVKAEQASQDCLDWENVPSVDEEWGPSAAAASPAPPAGGESGIGMEESLLAAVPVDITQVDAIEQQRIWDDIVFAARKPSGVAKRQGSIKAFLSPPAGSGAECQG